MNGGVQIHVLEIVRGFKDELEISLGKGEEAFPSESAYGLRITVHILPSLIRTVNPIEKFNQLDKLYI